jgi:hypothetical protein
MTARYAVLYDSTVRQAFDEYSASTSTVNELSTTLPP